MSVIYTTAFPGANEDPLSEGGKWSGDGVNGAVRLITNAIASHSADTDSATRYIASTPNAAHYSKVRYSTLGPTNSDGGPAVSCDSLGNHYFLTHFSGAMHLFRLRGNGTTFEERSGGGAPFTTTMTANDVWQLERRGTGLATNLIALQNGVQRINFTDSGDANALAAGGSFGVHIFDGTLRFNLVEGGDFQTDTPRRARSGPGVGPDRYSQFTRPARSNVIAGIDVTVALTGQSATFTAGTMVGLSSQPVLAKVPRPGPGIGPFSNLQFVSFARSNTLPATSPDVTLGLTGQAATFTPGTSVPSTTVAQTGNAATFAAGTMPPTRTLAVTGQGAAFAAGTLAPSLQLALGGISITSAAGTLTPSTTVAFTGQRATFTAGVLTLPGDVTLALTGQAFTSAAGSMTPATARALTGSLITSAAGTVVASSGVVVALTGQSAAFSAGTIAPQSTVALTGAAITASPGVMFVGVPTPISGQTVTVLGSVSTTLNGPSSTTVNG